MNSEETDALLHDDIKDIVEKEEDKTQEIKQNEEDKDEETSILKEEEEEEETSKGLLLFIKSASQTDYQVTVLPTDLISHVKSLISFEILQKSIKDSEESCLTNIPSDSTCEVEQQPVQYIRLIYQGKLLQDNETVLSYSIPNKAYLHASITTQQPTQKPSLNHLCSSGHDENENENGIRRGFDRLRAYISRDEVQALRLYFYPQVARWIEQSEIVQG